MKASAEDDVALAVLAVAAAAAPVHDVQVSAAAQHRFPKDSTADFHLQRIWPSRRHASCQRSGPNQEASNNKKNEAIVNVNYLRARF